MSSNQQSTFNGGPAFPSERSMASGMTLRDYFAAKAMQAMCITDRVPGEASDALLDAASAAGRDPVHHLCVNAYEIADAMLAARAGT